VKVEHKKLIICLFRRAAHILAALPVANLLYKIYKVYKVYKEKAFSQEA
jgi:hypothetical protein